MNNVPLSKTHRPFHPASGFSDSSGVSSSAEAMPEGMPKHGETRSVKVLIDGVGYDAQLKNQGFDRTKYDGHADVIQKGITKEVSW